MRELSFSRLSSKSHSDNEMASLKTITPSRKFLFRNVVKFYPIAIMKFHEPELLQKSIDLSSVVVIAFGLIWVFSKIF